MYKRQIYGWDDDPERRKPAPWPIWQIEHALGLINGSKAPDGKVYLDPQGSAARQQVATILMNFCQNVKK